MKSKSLVFAALVAPALMLAQAPPVSAADQITNLSKVAIETGNLVIVGKTRVAGQTVKLDNTVATTVSDANRNFTFQLVYLPTDCIVELKVGTVIKTAVVADCGPKGVNPKGTCPERAPTAIMPLTAASSGPAKLPSAVEN